jgi:Tol biopolymer transport system component
MSAGDEILIASNYFGGNRDLVRIDAGDRLEMDRLTDGPAFDFQPDVSPDGSTVAFYRRGYCPSCVNDRGQADLFVMDADGTHPRPLTQSTGRDETDPEWAPDGRALVYTAATADGSSPMVMSADGQRVRPLAGEMANAVEPTWGVVANALGTGGPGDSPAAGGS